VAPENAAVVLRFVRVKGRDFEVRTLTDIGRLANLQTKTTPGFNELLVSFRFRNSQQADIEMWRTSELRH